MKRTLSIAGAVLLVTATSWGLAADPHSLRGIMQELGRQMGTLTQAIMADDRETIVAAAAAIADHPQPPLSERIRILGSLGTAAPAFRQADKDVHDAAIAVKQAAEAGDRDALAAGFHRLTRSCLACHTRFRNEDIKALTRPAEPGH
ncbi:MAG TPA: cytochrome c [Thiohalobacter sp.]|nr:cytochrome c [Thiohalobacter sp.]